MKKQKNNEWDEIEKSESTRRYSMLGKDGFDFIKYSEGKLTKEALLKEKKMRKQIKFIEYMGNRSVIIGSYIKVGEKLIIPHGTQGENNETIRNNAIKLYKEAVE